MYLLAKIKNLFIDFLFPKNRKVLELEALSTDTLLKTLPRADFARPKAGFVEPKAGNLKDKYTIALFDYAHPLVKEIVWEIKYKGNRQIANKLGAILYDVIIGELEDLNLFESASWRMDRPLLVPIPVSDKRRFERGWNQSELLAEQIMTYDSGKVFKYLPRQLAKLRHTESQTKTASRGERLKNITDSMKVLNASSVTGRCVIVLDDVTTTGSTFAEAKRALHAAGAKKILCVAIAH